MLRGMQEQSEIKFTKVTGFVSIIKKKKKATAHLWEASGKMIKMKVAQKLFPL